MAREILSTKVFRSRDRDYLAEKRGKNNGGLEEEVRARGGSLLADCQNSRWHSSARTFSLHLNLSRLICISPPPK